jgi:O-methyltransferase involved in polyketide biosynthesis
MPDKTQVELGQVQQTLFFPLLARARETESKRPLLNDPKAVELVREIGFDQTTFRSLMRFMVVIRTMIFDLWIRQFLTDHPNGTVVELGTGLNTRFERTDNGSVHWIDLDLPDTIELRRRFFADTDRRRMLAASLLDEDWLLEVGKLPGPYFFVSDGVLVYLREAEVTGALARIAARFPDSRLAFDTYPLATFKFEHRMAAKRGVALWQWPCDDPRALERLGLRLLESARVTRPPAGLRASLPARYRYLLPFADPVVGRGVTLSLFRTAPVRPSLRPWTVRPAWGTVGGRLAVWRVIAVSGCRRWWAGRGSPSCRPIERAGCADHRRS